MDHVSVLLTEVLDAFQPKADARILDCTLGLGGHSKALAARVGESVVLTGIDADTDNLVLAQQHLVGTPGTYEYIHGNFADVLQTIMSEGKTFDFILADLGVSSLHFDDPNRGFSFRHDGPLDLRFDRQSGTCCSDWIQSASESDIANVLYQFGEIRQSRKIASALKENPPQTTIELRQIVESTCGHHAKSLMAQVFQALRIAVNNELHSLEVLLDIAPQLLTPGGRLAIISFHSLEDRLVKKTFKNLSTAEIDDRTGQDRAPAPFLLLSRKPFVPSSAEIERNPRSRSAKMRVLERRE